MKLWRVVFLSFLFVVLIFFGVGITGNSIFDWFIGGDDVVFVDEFEPSVDSSDLDFFVDDFVSCTGVFDEPVGVAPSLLESSGGPPPFVPEEDCAIFSLAHVNSLLTGVSLDALHILVRQCALNKGLYDPKKGGKIQKIIDQCKKPIVNTIVAPKKEGEVSTVDQQHLRAGSKRGPPALRCPPHTDGGQSIILVERHAMSCKILDCDKKVKRLECTDRKHEDGKLVPFKITFDVGADGKLSNQNPGKGMNGRLIQQVITLSIK